MIGIEGEAEDEEADEEEESRGPGRGAAHLSKFASQGRKDNSASRSAVRDAQS